MIRNPKCFLNWNINARDMERKTNTFTQSALSALLRPQKYCWNKQYFSVFCDVCAYDYVNWYKHNSYIHQDHTCNSVDILKTRRGCFWWRHFVISIQFGRHMLWLLGCTVHTLCMNLLSFVGLHDTIYVHKNEREKGRKDWNEKRTLQRTVEN